MAGTEKKSNNGNGEIYHPPSQVAARANVGEYDKLYQRSLEDPAGFWGERAGELEWFEPWTNVIDDSKKPFFQWFVGGKTNIVHNALDRHLKTYRKNKVALIWEGEPGDTRMYSYFSLNREVCKFANVLKSLGVKKGDIVTIYLPRIPEQVITMLACAKIGAAHSTGMPKYRSALFQQMSRTIPPRWEMSAGSSPASTSRPKISQRRRRKYSCRG